MPQYLDSNGNPVDAPAAAPAAPGPAPAVSAPAPAAPVYLDDNGNPMASASPAQGLQGAVSYGVQQDPVKYAALLDLQKRIGIAPAISAGNEQQMRQAADVNSINYPQFAAANPRTTAWATSPGNAAVAGVDEIHRVAGFEQHAATMRAYTPTLWDRVATSYRQAVKTATGKTTDELQQGLYENPLTRGAIDVVGGVSGMAGNIGSFFGWHGDDATKQNLLQRVETQLAPENNTDPAATFHQSNQFDWLMKNVAPMVPAVLATGGAGLLARTLGVSDKAAKVMAGLTVGGLFDLDQAGKTYTAVAGAGGSDYDARLAANKVALVNAPANALFGATDVVPLLRDNPLLTSLGLGGATGATGQVGQNVVTGQPWAKGVTSAMVQGAAMQGGMHLGMSAFAGHVADAVDSAEQSPLRARSPEKFAEALQTVFEGDASLKIPADAFQAHFTGAGMDPAEVAKGLGSTNYAEAVLSGGDVEVPPADYLSKLDPEHQKALLPHIVDPETGLTATQHAEGLEELRQWAAGDGPEKLQAEAAAADAETAATPKWQAVKEDLRQRYVDAGETPEVAESLATTHANVVANLARESGRTPAELMAMYAPKVTTGEAPGSEVLYQARLRRDEQVEGSDGHETTLLTPTREIPAKYRLIEADQLQPSHNAQTFAVNPQYPANVQERAYDTSKEAQGRVIAQAQNYDPRYTVNTNPDAVNGPPVITPDGTVLGGNSRAMSTQRLYAADGSAYKAALKEQATAYGFTPEQVEAMDKPVLVRQIEHPANLVEARRLGTELNKSMTGAMGVSERAVSAGKNITPDTLRSVSAFMQADDSTLREAMNRHGAEMVRMLVSDGVITERERPQFVDAATGGLSDEGRAYVERALMGTVIDDPRLMDAAPKSVLAKLERSLGAITSFASRADEWNLLPAIREAVAELGSIQRSGSTVDLRLGQTSMFGDLRNPVVDAVIRRLDGKPNAVREAFEQYSRDADQNLPGQARFFAGGEAFDAFNAAFGTTLTEQEYHDGLTESAGTSPVAAHGANSFGDEGVPGSAGGDAAPGSAGGAGHPTPEAEADGEPEPAVNASEVPASEKTPAAKEPPRGWFRMLPDGSFEIGKTKVGDLSTFVHEPAHVYLEMFEGLSARDGASDQLKSDFQMIREFVGAKDGEAFTTAQKEIWARANEQYLREGKAPSEGLKGVFQRFAVWLGSIYKKATDLGVELTPEIRAVMDRMYASEDGVNRAAREAGPHLFTSAEEAGWTEAEFKRYAEEHGVSVDAAKSHVFGMLNEAAARERTQAWRDEEANVRQAQAELIDARPEYKAIRGLRKGELEDGTPLTLNRSALVEQFGEDRVRKLQEQHPGLYRANGGADAETAAELHGFSSAEEMMRALEAAPRRNAAIEQATRAYMTAEHGDIRYDGTLDGKARLAVENDTRAAGLYRELKALKAKLAKMDAQRQAMRDITIAPLDAYREAAHQMVEKKAVADLQPMRYLDASRKYSREAFDALRKGNAEAAANAKHKELLNHFLFREATAAKEYIGKFENYAKRGLGKTVQSNLGLAGSDYRAQFNKLMFRGGLSRMPAEMPERPLSAWADDMYEQGKEPAIDPALFDENRGMNYRRASVAEVRLLHDALRNIKTLAYQEMHAVVNGRKIAFADAKTAMMARARESLKVHPEAIFAEDRDRGEKARDLVNRGLAPLTRTEFLMKRLDGGVEGPWHDYLWNLAADSQGVERELQESVTKIIGDALQNMPDTQRMRMLEKVTLPGWGELTRKRLISMALNLGNAGNLDRLRKTFAFHGSDPAAVERIPQMLSREDWQLVQGLWDSLKPMGARMNEMERRLTGLPPVMVTPTPLHVDLADGSAIDLEGGYYPIVMDPRYSERAQQQDVNVTARNLMESGYGRASTSRGYTKERTGFAGPLLLDHEQVLTQHIAKASKDISHREFILAANRLLGDKEVQQTLRETVGKGYEEQMMPWLRTIVNDRNGSAVQGLGDFSNWMSRLRTNVVQASLGFKLSTLLLQVTHASSIFLHTSASSYSQAMVNFLAHPDELTEQIRNLSPNEMKHRGENIDRDMRAMLQDGIQGPRLGTVVAKAGMFPVKMVDHVLSFPLWHAVYNDAMAEHAELPEDQAQYLAMHKADGAVRMALGSNAPKDLPAVMRRNDFWKMVTTLGGFENLKLNQIADAAFSVSADRRAGAGVAAAGGKFTYRMLMAAIIPAVVGAYVHGNRPKDDENSAEWAAKRALLFAPETVPLLGNVVRAIDEGGDAQFTPVINVVTKAVTAGVQAKSDKEDKDWTGIGLNAGEAAGQAAGVPGTTQAVRTLRYAHRAQMGEINDPNAWDAVVGAPHK